MGIATLLLLASLVCLVFLAGYAAIYLVIAFGSFGERFSGAAGPAGSPLEQEEGFERPPVTVLIPAHHEGPALLDAVASVLAQNYAGLVRIEILVENEFDSAVDSLCAHFQTGTASSAERTTPAAAGDPIEVRLHRSERRAVVLVLTGLKSKRKKINQRLPRIRTECTAFLDADHRPTANWLESSLSGLVRAGAAGIQTRRAALSVGRLPQLWDSLQNHVGNEAVNRLFRKLGLAVFFTGTAAVFRTDSIAASGLPASVTEDTALSYRLLMQGERIAYNDRAVSYEEMAPGFRAYVARRMRWACGHTAAFFGRLKDFRGLSGFLPRLQFLLHGQFYLVPAVITALLNLYGFYYLLQNPPFHMLGIAGAALIASVLLAAALVPASHRRFSDYLVGMLWTLPVCAIQAAETLYYLADLELYHRIILFPYQREMLPLHIVLIAMPVVALIAAAFSLRSIPLAKLWIIPLTYPIFLFLEVYATLLGLFDALAGRQRWTPVSRDYAVDAGPAGNRIQISLARVAVDRLPRILFALSVPCFLFLAHEALAEDNCGEPRGLFWDPIIPWNNSRERFSVVHEKTAGEPGRLDFRLELKLAGRESGDSVGFAATLDGRELEPLSVPEPGRAAFRFSLPQGWAKHTIAARVRFAGRSCGRELQVTSVLKEVREKRLFVNGEPFLIKGIVPSLPAGLSADGVLPGLLQRFQLLGANAVRVYHRPTGEMLDALRRTGLVVVGQPDNSTWSNLDLFDEGDRSRLLERYTELQREANGEPQVLFHHLGNELELAKGCWESGMQRSICVARIQSLLDQAGGKGIRPRAYSTFHTFVDYDVEILGVNMLESGRLYWSDRAGSDLYNLKEFFPGAFYASELGGFVADSERLPEALRTVRLLDQWRRLRRAGALGAFVFQSHDNWAQPVVSGYNDPFLPEHPDDLRGLWDRADRPKLITRFVARMFRDLDLELRPDGPHRFQLEFANRRQYALENLRLRGAEGGLLFQTDRLPAEERVRFSVPSEKLLAYCRAGRCSMEARYETHRGLPGVTRLVASAPGAVDRPVVENEDAVLAGEGPRSIAGTLYYSRTLRLRVPESWRAIRLNGRRIEVARGRLEVPIGENPYVDLETEYFKAQGTPVESFDPDSFGPGPMTMEITLPSRARRSDAYVLLGGLSARSLRVETDRRSWTRSVHHTREVLLPVVPEMRDRFRIHLVRKDLGLPGGSLPGHEDRKIRLEAPRLFAPFRFRVERDECTGKKCDSPV